MKDEPTRRTRRRSQPRDEEPLDPEQAEALSRAARQAVRQPADPRIETSFAHLGLVPDPEPEDGSTRPTATPARRRSRRAPAAVADPAPNVAESSPAVTPSDLQPLIDGLASLQGSAAELRRRIDLLMWLLAGVLVLVGVLAVILIVRGPA